MVNKIPSPRSVVVPVDLAETPAIRNTLGLLRSAILCGEQWSDTCRDAYLAALKELDQLARLAAAPSSLAGGASGRLSALLSSDHLRGDYPIAGLGAVSWNDLRAILAALSPEAPASEGGA